MSVFNFNIKQFPLFRTEKEAKNMKLYIGRATGLVAKPTRREKSGEIFPCTVHLCLWHRQTDMNSWDRNVLLGSVLCLRQICTAELPTASSTHASHKNLHACSPKLCVSLQDKWDMLGTGDFLLEVAERLLFSWAGRVPLLIYLILLKSHGHLWIWFHRYLINLLKTLALTVENLHMRQYIKGYQIRGNPKCVWNGFYCPNVLASNQQSTVGTENCYQRCDWPQFYWPL